MTSLKNLINTTIKPVLVSDVKKQLADLRDGNNNYYRSIEIRVHQADFTVDLMLTMK